MRVVTGPDWEFWPDFNRELGLWLRRTLPDGRRVEVFPILHGHARLGITPPPRGDYYPPVYDRVF